MIFSKENCPLCGKELFKIYMDPLTHGVHAHTLYHCNMEVETRNLANTGVTSTSHYLCQDYGFDLNSAMYLPGFLLRHSDSMECTSIYVTSLTEPNKYVTTCRLLDMDYSQPQDAASRLKRLVIFS